MPDLDCNVKTLGELISWGAMQFETASLVFGHGSDNAWDEAALLVLHAVGLPPENTRHDLEQVLTDQQKQLACSLLLRRIAERKPAAYLIHQAWFAGLRFYVDERVLIPRSPLAELIEARLEPWIQAHRVRSILDLCTGSGCIGIACAYYFPHAHIDVSDISSAALEVARENIEHHGLQERVAAIQSDLFEELRERRYDIIISNPPYVDAENLAALAPEYGYEPAIALAGGEYGLDLVERILRQSAQHLNPEGVLIIEVGDSEANLVARYPQIPFMWLEFERGGYGVCVLTAEQCLAYLS